ncbi:hypothetical protein [uncultured Pseudokineococcus sp.]|uniref:hypothetical protein n=1 Tax=uncultured Pseudokineococcus sp. TaxID=1642928 RepID=UPI00260DC7BE|nr:hypothetical protein [uncultured Pseudokineococcus sp.]
MATYQYLCVRDGPFDVSAPIGTASPVLPCPACADEGRRVITAPMLSRGSSPAMAALDRSARSAHEPEVVTSLPPSGRPRPRPATTAPPSLQRLPRP